MGATVFVNNRALTDASGSALSTNFPCVGKTPGPPGTLRTHPVPQHLQGLRHRERQHQGQRRREDYCAEGLF